MALIVEDGTGKTDSDTYADDATLTAYAVSLGIADLPVDTDELNALLLNAMTVLETKCWKGSRTYPENPQALSFPRSGLSYDGVAVPEDSIPQQLIDAQCSYAITANTVSLWANNVAGSPGGQVIEETVVGAVTVKYAANAGGGATIYETVDARADALIRPFTCGFGGLFGIRA